MKALSLMEITQVLGIVRHTPAVEQDYAYATVPTTLQEHFDRFQ